MINAQIIKIAVLIISILIAIFGIRFYGESKYNDGFLEAGKQYQESNQRLADTINEIRIDIEKSNTVQIEAIRKTSEEENKKLYGILQEEFYNRVCIQKDAIDALNNRGKK